MVERASTAPGNGLFRQEMLDYRYRRVEGEIVILPSLRAWGAVVAFVAVLGSGLLWAAIAEYSRVEIVPGVIAPDVPIIRVVPPRVGTVTQLYVHEGQHVRAGQLLAVVDASAGAVASTTPQAQEIALSSENEHLAARQLALNSQIELDAADSLTQMALGLQAQDRQLAAQIVLQSAMVTSAQSLAASARGIYSRGYMTRDDFERRQTDALKREQELEQLRAQRASVQAELGKTRIELSGHGAASAQRRAGLLAALNTASRARIEAESAAAYGLRATADGIVTGVQTAVGDRLELSKPAFTIIPTAARLVVEAFASTRAIGFIAPGQQVNVRLDAFPYQRFGTFPGRVVSISKTVILPNEGRAPLRIEAPAYRLVIALGRTAVATPQGDVNIRSGMTAQASVVVQKQSFLRSFLPHLFAWGW